MRNFLPCLSADPSELMRDSASSWNSIADPQVHLRWTDFMDHLKNDSETELESELFVFPNPATLSSSVSVSALDRFI